MRISQLAQVACNDVYLGAPAEVERAAWSEQLVPLVIGQMALNAVAEGDRLIVCGPHLVPGERDDRSVRVLPLDLFDHGRPREHGVLVVTG